MVSSKVLTHPQINYFDWAIFNSKLLVYQRVWDMTYGIYLWDMIGN